MNGASSMSEMTQSALGSSAQAGAAASAGKPSTPGGMLREARQSQGLHIAALAATINVAPRKLELLESDQFDLLPDPAFARALAQTVCRTLKVDAAPVLAMLPPLHGTRLGKTSDGLNAPFQERPERLAWKEKTGVASPVLWLALVLLIAAAVVYFGSPDWLPFPKAASTRMPSATAPQPLADNRSGEPTVSAPPSAAFVPTLEAVTPSAGSASMTSAAGTSPATSTVTPTASGLSTSTTVAAPNAGLLQLRATTQSWVEVTDAGGRALLARLVMPGENVGIDGALPLKVRIGNASGVQVVFRDRPIDLVPSTRGNVVQLELK